MATGRNTQLTRQIGEHLVAAELGRKNLIATPFAGNVPQFDLLVATEDGRAMPIQVKAINGPSWQFNAANYLQIDIKEGFQTVLGPRADIYRDLVCVFVRLRAPGTDEFYSLTIRDLQQLLQSKYKGGRRPKNPKSTHCALWPEHIESYRGWKCLEEILAARGGVA